MSLLPLFPLYVQTFHAYAPYSIALCRSEELKEREDCLLATIDEMRVKMKSSIDALEIAEDALRKSDEVGLVLVQYYCCSN